MYSRRAIEDLNIKKIDDYLVDCQQSNKIIINNSSKTTNTLKNQYSERLLTFFNVVLAATLLSSFILYKQSSNCLFNQNRYLYFIFILLISCVVLLFFTITSIINNVTQYKRQRIYREINLLLYIILNNSYIFFYGSQDINNIRHISIETLDSFINTIKKMLSVKKFKRNLFKDMWGRIISALLITFVIVVSLIILVIIIIDRSIKCVIFL